MSGGQWLDGQLIVLTDATVLVHDQGDARGPCDCAVVGSDELNGQHDDVVEESHPVRAGHEIAAAGDELGVGVSNNSPVLR
jgi:hypothetical protein